MKNNILLETHVTSNHTHMHIQTHFHRAVWGQ